MVVADLSGAGGPGVAAGIASSGPAEWLKMDARPIPMAPRRPYAARWTPGRLDIMVNAGHAEVSRSTIALEDGTACWP